jgi:hypothetical protein
MTNLGSGGGCALQAANAIAEKDTDNFHPRCFIWLGGKWWNGGMVEGGKKYRKSLENLKKVENGGMEINGGKK